ncbi:MAG TPA: hypothetical protein VGD55_13365 [Acidothermaceae bacterium]
MGGYRLGDACSGAVEQCLLVEQAHGLDSVFYSPVGGIVGAATRGDDVSSCDGKHSRARSVIVEWPRGDRHTVVLVS